MIISDEDRMDFLTRSWELRLTFCGIKTETVNENVKKYAIDLLKDAQTTFTEQILDFIGVPLQLKMLSESFPPKPDLDTATLCGYEKQVGNMTNIYQTFVSKKVDIYLMDKLQHSSNSAVKCKKFLMKNIEIHRNFAFRLLFPDKARMCYAQKDMEKEDQHLHTAFAIGLIIYERGSDGETKYNFVHRTFAEYFAADLCVNWIEHPGNCAFPHLGDFVYFLLENDMKTKVVKIFLNEMLKTLCESDSEYFSTFLDRFSIVQYFCDVMKIEREREDNEDKKFRCIEYFNHFYFNQVHISLYKFLLQIVFRNVDSGRLMRLKCDDNVSLLEALYYSIIDKNIYYSFRKLIDAIQLPKTLTDPYPNPPVHILLLNKARDNCGLRLTLISRTETSIDRNCFEIKEQCNTMDNGMYIIYELNLTQLPLFMQSMAHDKKLINSLGSKEILEHRHQSPFQYVFYLLACKRAADRYIAGFILKVEQGEHTVFISQAFSNWKIVLAKSYSEIPSPLTIWRDYETFNQIT